MTVYLPASLGFHPKQMVFSTWVGHLPFGYDIIDEIISWSAKESSGSPRLNEQFGFGFDNQNDFLRAARILEDIGVTAYAGAAGFLKTPDIITAAACLLGAEAEHASSIRTQIARLKIPTAALDGVDLVPPPSGSGRQTLSIKTSDGLVATRTAGQVLYLAFGMKAGVKQGGFFPTGLNGTIASSTEPAAASNACLLSKPPPFPPDSHRLAYSCRQN